MTCKNIDTKARGRLRSVARRGDCTLAAFPRPSEYPKRRLTRYSEVECCGETRYGSGGAMTKYRYQSPQSPSQRR